MIADPIHASVRIEAPPETVFRYFTDDAAMVAWMGDRADLDPRPGGRFEVAFRGNVVRGEYLELDPPRRIVFSWGHVGSEELPPGSSRVEVAFEPEDGGTLVRLVHTGFPTRGLFDEHARGWDRYLPRLAEAA